MQVWPHGCRISVVENTYRRKEKPMTYQEFLSRVQSRAGLSSHEETVRAVTATLETLREYLEGGGVNELPQELRRLVPSELLGAGSGQPGNVAGVAETTNP